LSGVTPKLEFGLYYRTGNSSSSQAFFPSLFAVLALFEESLWRVDVLMGAGSQPEWTR
jgi:hypothetical protein